MGEGDLHEDEWVGHDYEDYVEDGGAVGCLCPDVEDEEQGHVADDQFCDSVELGVADHLDRQGHRHLDRCGLVGEIIYWRDYG